MNNKYTFWQLIQENIIEVPIIQRDYAQGRTNQKAEKIRNNFLDTLHKKIRDEDDKINLDFVYGKLEDNKLIPLDGQQRLTTLFLLHWYLALIDGKLLDYKDVLRKFTYETRVSSREFCNALVSNPIEFSDSLLSQNIENKNWFFQSWKKDPTIQSMLTMIDSIHARFKDSQGLFENLISIDNPPITFDFLPLNEFKLTDELYVKMNARGKPLTDFEDFKAKFVELLSDEDTSKLDNSWTDLFWSQHKEFDEKSGYYNIDEKFLNFFTNITVNFGMINEQIDIKKNVEKLNIMDIYDDVYKKEQSTYNSSLSHLVKILDFLVKLSLNNDDLLRAHFDYFIEKQDISYWDRAKFFAFCQYVLNLEEIDLTSENYINWKRITDNIINNYNIDSVKKFQDILKLIDTMGRNIINIHEYICSSDFLQKETFGLRSLEFQQNEERVKSELILKDNENRWEKAILEAEKHPYLNGHIGFLIKYADNNLEKFIKLYNRFKTIFIEDKENFWLQRALLTKGDYLVGEITPYSNRSFCSFQKDSPRNKDDNWKQVFYNKGNILKDLLEDNRDLKDIVDEFEFNSHDWRSGFIKIPAILKYCKRYQIRMSSEKDILLLTKERVYGQHAEYYTYCLYNELKDKYKDNTNSLFIYQDNKSTNEDKFIQFDENKILFRDGQWFFNNEVVSNRNELLNIINEKVDHESI